MARIVLSHDYPAPPQAVWQLAIDFDAFAKAMQGVATLRNLPTGRLQQGMVIDAEVSLLGKLPWQPHHMEIEVCDHQAMTFQSRERGPGIKRWDHHLKVTKTNTGCRLTDTVEIEAERSWLTPIYALWARFVYTRRHAPRMEMLNQLQEA
ncbi:SRPBCC family protein [Ahrensia marina]|uniref:SRPBCC family protein n=1 Tax=Ahrensia marina TaxID=1514904 RepID=UPI0035CFE04A